MEINRSENEIVIGGKSYRNHYHADHAQRADYAYCIHKPALSQSADLLHGQFLS